MNCLRCINWNLREYTRMQRFGFGLCRLEQPPFIKARFHGPISSCNKFSPAPEAAITKRKAMLK